jgi:hypothetical protein
LKDERACGSAFSAFYDKRIVDGHGGISVRNDKAARCYKSMNVARNEGFRLSEQGFRSPGVPEMETAPQKSCREAVMG